MSPRRRLDQIGENDGAYEYLETLTEEELRPTLTENALEKGAADFTADERNTAWSLYEPD